MSTSVEGSGTAETAMEFRSSEFRTRTAAALDGLRFPRLKPKAINTSSGKPLVLFIYPAHLTEDDCRYPRRSIQIHLFPKAVIVIEVKESLNHISVHHRQGWRPCPDRGGRLS